MSAYRFFLPLLAAALAVAAPVSAEYYGLPNGRSADLSLLPDMSVEFGFVLGDIPVGDAGDLDYQHIGGRVNFRYSPQVMLYGDIGQTEIEDFDGIIYGGGVFYQTEGIFPGSDFTFKAGYHRGEVEDEGEADVSALNFEGLFSGKQPLGTSDLRWYGSIGFHRLTIEVSGDDDSETEIGFGGGVYQNTQSGQIYGGIDLIDEMTFGIGYRHFLN